MSYGNTLTHSQIWNSKSLNLFAFYRFPPSKGPLTAGCIGDYFKAYIIVHYADWVSRMPPIFTIIYQTILLFLLNRTQIHLGCLITDVVLLCLMNEWMYVLLRGFQYYIIYWFSVALHHISPFSASSGDRFFASSLFPLPFLTSFRALVFFPPPPPPTGN